MSQDMLERLYLLTGLGIPWFYPGQAAGGGRGDGGLSFCLSCCPCHPISERRCMDVLFLRLYEQICVVIVCLFFTVSYIYSAVDHFGPFWLF